MDALTKISGFKDISLRGLWRYIAHLLLIVITLTTYGALT